MKLISVETLDQATNQMRILLPNLDTFFVRGGKMLPISKNSIQSGIQRYIGDPLKNLL